MAALLAADKPDHNALIKLASKTAYQHAQLKLICKDKTIYGPTLVGVTRPQDNKVVLSFNTFVTDVAVEIVRVELYDDNNTLVWRKDVGVKLNKRQSIQFWFEVVFSTELNYQVK